ncbi:MAG TPA: hypothetical protein VF181_12480 [Balneolaceae bacterium]
MKKLTINTLVLSISLLLAFVLGEWMCRLFLNPADYLTVQLVDDPILDHKISSEVEGYDKWGFRNYYVPDTADVVTIGDSQTFGNNATTEGSWPKVLGQITDQKVYNLSLGSYNPVQYYYLLKTKALKLDPERVIVGFYLGNDLMGAYQMAYYREYWHHLRDSTLVNNIDRSGENIIDSYIQADPVQPDEQFLGHLRAYLSHNSILYRLTVHGPVLGYLKRKVERIFKASQSEEFTRLILPEKNINEGFRPVHRGIKMDMDNIRIREGMRISLHLLNKMNKICEQNGIKFNVVFLPSKALVFAEYLTFATEVNNYVAVQNLLSNERELLEISKAFFDAHQISYLSPVPALREQIGKAKIYPANYDDHPTPYGYSVIAQSIKEQLNQQPIVEKVNATK